MSIFLFSLFDCFNFSTYYFCLADIIQLVCWSGRVSTSKCFIQFFELSFRTCPALFF